MSIIDLEKKIKKSATEEVRGLHIFSNEKRRAVYRELTRRPCRTESSIARAARVDVKVASWHLWKLMHEGYVAYQTLERRCYYVPELVDTVDLNFFHLLNSPVARRLVRYALDGCKEIKKIRTPKSTLYRYLSLLEEQGYIYRKKYRGAYMCANNSLLRLAEKYEERGMNFKREILKKLEYPGFHVRVLGEVNHELKIEISGLETFTMGVFISPLITSLEV